MNPTTTIPIITPEQARQRKLRRPAAEPSRKARGRGESQCDWVLRQLRTGRGLTHLEAETEYGISRIAARVCELRKAGHNIERTMLETPGGKHVAQYRLIEPEERELF